MSVAPYVLSQHAVVLQEQLHVSTDNVSHGKTVGHRNSHLAFHTYMHPSPQGPSVAYSVAGLSWQSPTPGALDLTGDHFHIALQGRGFFALENGGYTRAGVLALNSNRELTTPSGARYLDTGGEVITVPDGVTLNISDQGELLDKTGRPFVRLGVFTFEDERFLKKVGGLSYPRSGQTAAPATEFRILQKYLEGSNVSTIHEMTRMGQITTAYQGTQNLLKQFYESQKNQINLLVKTN